MCYTCYFWASASQHWLRWCKLQVPLLSPMRWSMQSLAIFFCFSWQDSEVTESELWLRLMLVLPSALHDVVVLFVWQDKWRYLCCLLHQYTLFHLRETRIDVSSTGLQFSLFDRPSPDYKEGSLNLFGWSGEPDIKTDRAFCVFYCIISLDCNERLSTQKNASPLDGVNYRHIYISVDVLTCTRCQLSN